MSLHIIEIRWVMGKGHVNQNREAPGTITLGNEFILFLSPIKRILKLPEPLGPVTRVAAVMFGSIFLSDFFL